MILSPLDGSAASSICFRFHAITQHRQFSDLLLAVVRISWLYRMNNGICSATSLLSIPLIEAKLISRSAGRQSSGMAPAEEVPCSDSRLELLVCRTPVSSHVRKVPSSKAGTVLSSHVGTLLSSLHSTRSYWLLLKLWVRILIKPVRFSSVIARLPWLAEVLASNVFLLGLHWPGALLQQANR